MTQLVESDALIAQRVAARIAAVKHAMSVVSSHRSEYLIGELTAYLWLQGEGRIDHAGAYQAAIRAWHDARMGHRSPARFPGNKRGQAT